MTHDTDFTRRRAESRAHLDAVMSALAELEEGRRRLATAKREVDDPRLVTEMERLVAQRQATLDELVDTIQDHANTDLLSADIVAPQAKRTAVALQAAAAGDDGVMEALHHGETRTIGTLRDALEEPLPDAVQDVVRDALTQAGKMRDHLELVAR